MGNLAIMMLVAAILASITLSQALPFVSEDRGTVHLARFDGSDKALAHSWRETNDPVMGGASNGTFSIKNGVAIMDGNVNLIPRLQAPGFIKFETYGMKGFPDASKCKSLHFVVRSLTNYSGYRVSIGNKHAPGGKFFALGYK